HRSTASNATARGRGHAPQAASGAASSGQRAGISTASGVKKRREQFFTAEIIRHDVVGSDADQALPFPLVHALASRLFTSDADRDATHVLDLLDLDVAVAKPQELMSLKLSGRENSLDQNGFGKTLVIVQGAVHAAFKVLGDAEQPCLLSHVDLVGAARQIHLQPALTQLLQQGARSGNQIVLGISLAFAQRLDPILDLLP